MDLGLQPFSFFNGDGLIALKHGYELIAFFFILFLNGDGPITLKYGNGL